MTRASGERQRRRRPELSGGSIGLLITLFLLPAPFEILFGIVKRESYDYTRLGVVLGALAILAVVIVLARRPWHGLASILGYFVVLAGFGLLALGILVNFRAGLVFDTTKFSSATITTLSALMPLMGALLASTGLFFIRTHRRRKRPAPPADIAKPEHISAGGRDVAVWQSNAFRQQPAAEGVTAIFTKWLDIRDLHYIALFDANGDCQCYADLLDDSSLQRYDIGDRAKRRRRYELAGSYLTEAVAEGNQILDPVGTGILVRVVLDVERGALFYYRLRNRGYVVGITLSQSDVDPTDRKLSRAVNDILELWGGRPDDDFFRVPTYVWDEQNRASANPATAG